MKKSDIRQELVDIYGISEVLAVKEVPPPIEKKESPQTSLSSWAELREALANCKKCVLAKTRQTIVFGEGDEKAALMFIGEGPGADEDREGRPFVGKAGQLLTKMIEAMGLTRAQVYIANIVKCRPPENREPLPDEVSACIAYLKNQIRLINPKIIVCLGGTAATHLLNPGRRISAIRGKFMTYEGIKVMPTYHPSYLLRNESEKRNVWNDLKLVMSELGLKK